MKNLNTVKSTPDSKRRLPVTVYTSESQLRSPRILFPAFHPWLLLTHGS